MQTNQPREQEYVESDESQNISSVSTKQQSSVQFGELDENQEQGLLQKKLNKPFQHSNDAISTLKWLGFGLVSILILAFLLILYYKMPYIMNKTQAIFKWIQENPIIGCIIYLLIVFITGVLMFPIFIISIAGTISFKIAFGRLTSFLITLFIGSIGYYGACLVSFVIGRLFCYKCSRRWLMKYDIFQALDGGFQQRGIYLSFLLRASFIVPYNILNVVMGVTKISFKDYAIGTTAIATHIFFNALIGISISDLTNLFHGNYKDNEFYFWSMIIGTVVTIIMFILVVMILNKQLNQIVQKKKMKMRKQIS